MTSHELTQAMKDALAIIEGAGVPEDLREVAFVRALDQLLGTSPVLTRTPGGDAETSGAEIREDQRLEPPGDPLTKIAHKLGIDANVASRVFDIEENDVYLISARGRFPRAKLSATQQVATLVAAARQAAEFDVGWTPASAVRTIADQKGVLDSSNFGQAIAGLSDQGMRLRGSGRTREIKVLDTGFEAAGALARELAGGE